MPPQSLGMALSTYTGQNYGSQNVRRIRQGVGISAGLSLGVGVALMAVILPLSGPLVTLFVSAKEVEVIAIAKEYLGVVAMYYWLCGLMNVFLSLYRGMGKMFISTCSSMLEPASKVIAAFIFGNMFGRMGLWAAWPVGWVFALALPLFLFLSGKAFKGVRLARI